MTERNESRWPTRSVSRACAALAAAVLASGCGTSGGPPAPERAEAVLRDANGQEVGRVSLRQAPHGVLLHVSIDGLPAGVHALHVHERGECEPPFASAGGHFAPQGRDHGLLAEGGPHAGDLPNLFVPDSGRLEVEVFAPRLALGEAAGRGDLLDADGSAVLVHAGGDDYRSNPAGAAGGRIACGVVTAEAAPAGR